MSEKVISLFNQVASSFNRYLVDEAYPYQGIACLVQSESPDVFCIDENGNQLMICHPKTGQWRALSPKNMNKLIRVIAREWYTRAFEMVIRDIRSHFVRHHPVLARRFLKTFEPLGEQFQQKLNKTDLHECFRLALVQSNEHCHKFNADQNLIGLENGTLHLPIFQLMDPKETMIKYVNLKSRGSFEKIRKPFVHPDLEKTLGISFAKHFCQLLSQVFGHPSKHSIVIQICHKDASFLKKVVEFCFGDYATQSFPKSTVNHHRICILDDCDSKSKISKISIPIIVFCKTDYTPIKIQGRSLFYFVESPSKHLTVSNQHFLSILSHIHNKVKIPSKIHRFGQFDFHIQQLTESIFQKEKWFSNPSNNRNLKRILLRDIVDQLRVYARSHQYNRMSTKIKQSTVIPILKRLGYDIVNPRNVKTVKIWT